MFTARRGCYSNGKYSKSSACKAPSKARLHDRRQAFQRGVPVGEDLRALERGQPRLPADVQEPEAAPPSTTPRCARRDCKGCKVLGADVLDQSNVTTWLQGFIRYSHNKARIWGLHNYKDVNRHQSKGLTNVLKTVPGEVWLTETGGITTFLARASRRRPRAPRRRRSTCSSSRTASTPRRRATSRRSRGSTSTAGAASRTARSTPGS